MSIDANRTTFSCEFFKLNEDSLPADEKQFLHELTLLADQPLNVLSYPKEIEWAFQSIDKVKLNELNANNPDSTIYKRIQEVFQTWVKIKLGDQSRHIPRERLVQECGDKFKGQFTCKMKEQRDKTVKLLLPEGIPSQKLSRSLCGAFLIFLQTGEISNDALEEDVMTLLCLADQHRVEGLIAKCTKLIVENLNHENLREVLEFIENRYLPWLKVACLCFMQNHVDKISIEFKGAYKKELRFLNEMLKNGIEHRISPIGEFAVQIHSISKNTYGHLNKLNNLCPIRSLHLSDKKPSSQLPFLKEIAPTFKELVELLVSDESIHESVVAELKSLYPKLHSFGNNAPCLKSIDEVNAYLKNFSKPGFTDQESEKLHLLSLNLEGIPHLTDNQFEEFTPYIEDIHFLFIRSDKITKVIAPKAMWIHCSDCTSLKTLKANQAVVFNCPGCHNLSSLEANQATKLICYSCTKLISLKAPQAEEIYCSDCSILSSLEVPQAKRVYCCNCTNLTTIEAPQAEEIYCSKCISLTTLETPQVKVINFSLCQNITTLKAPQAKRIDCISCINLENLEAPRAEKVYCSKCISLTSLEVPQVKVINCAFCQSLTTLFTPQAEVINYSNCKNLTNLNVPYTARIIK